MTEEVDKIKRAVDEAMRGFDIGVHWILDGHTPIRATVLEWGKFFENKLNRTVKQEQIGDYWVSTVFLGIDYNWSQGGRPILFETMVFLKDEEKGRDNTGGCDRYATWDEAMAGHQQIAERLRESG